MRLIALADCHLGYRQFYRLTPMGRNQREVDVSGTFLKAVKQIVALHPDLVVVAGDVFHTPRPSPLVQREAMDGFKQLTNAGIRVVVIAGNHDGPKVHEGTGHVLSLLHFVGCEVVYQGVEHHNGITCVPERFTSDSSWLATSGDVLLLHGEVGGSLPFETKAAIPREHFSPEKWGYIALGHYHERSDLWSNGGYSGSLDFTSSDIWTEARNGKPKGFIEYDLETKARTFHSTEPRQVFDLPVIDCDGWSHQKMTASVVAAAEFSVPDDSIVRQRLHNVEKTEWRQADHKAMRQAGKRFLALQIDPVFTKSQWQKMTPTERNLNLEQRFIHFLQQRKLPDDLPLDKIMEQGLHYLREVQPEIATEAE